MRVLYIYFEFSLQIIIRESASYYIVEAFNFNQ